MLRVTARTINIETIPNQRPQDFRFDIAQTEKKQPNADGSPIKARCNTWTPQTRPKSPVSNNRKPKNVGARKINPKHTSNTWAIHKAKGRLKPEDIADQCATSY